jgi:cytochrome c5
MIPFLIIAVSGCMIGGPLFGKDGTAWQDSHQKRGCEIYAQACASCHDSGLDGAPVKGDRETWTNRSPLWSAVLLEHAKSGYLDMPAKGGHPELSDKDVEAAGEYMLNETFPEKPKG